MASNQQITQKLKPQSQPQAKQQKKLQTNPQQHTQPKQQVKNANVTHLYDKKELLITGFIYDLSYKPKQIEKSMIELIYKFYPTVSVIISHGSDSIKAGFGGQNSPFAIVSTVVGRLKLPSKFHNDIYIGDQATSNAGLCLLKYPIKHGMFKDWNDMEAIWDYIFYKKLHQTPVGSNLLLTEAPLNPKETREKLTEIMFEKYGVSGLYITIDAILALYASGRTSGIMLDCGDNLTSAVPIYEGCALKRAIKQSNISGRSVTDYLSGLLRDRYSSLTNKSIIRDIKEKHCYIASDYKKEVKEWLNDHEKQYILPDGQAIVMKKEQFIAPEMLFNPSLIGINTLGIGDMICSSLIRCPQDIRVKYLCGNIVITGGSTMFNGFPQRIKKEIEKLSPASLQIKVFAPPNRDKAAWIGGNILQSLSTFQEMLITRDEYENIGPSVVHEACNNLC